LVAAAIQNSVKAELTSFMTFCISENAGIKPASSLPNSIVKQYVFWLLALTI
jgi:hypothetical protein